MVEQHHHMKVECGCNSCDRLYVDEAVPLEGGAKKRRRRAKTPARPRTTTRRRRRGGADEDHVVDRGNFFNDMLDGVSKVASTVASAAPLVMPLLGAGPDDDEWKRVMCQLKTVQKRLRSFVDDKSGNNERRRT
jgi:hypothetical protein